MKGLQKMGGVAALYMATAYLVGIVLFLFVLDYPSIVEPAQKIALLANKEGVIYATNLLMYVVFGIFLTVLALALHARLESGAPALARTGAALGIVWATALIGSGMVANAGIAPVVALHGEDPAQAAAVWTGIEAVANGLGGANGEILGGLWTILVSWAGLRAGRFPKGLNYLGLVVGAVGIVSAAPGLHDLAGLFGMSQIVWFVWLGIILLSDTQAHPAYNFAPADV